MASPQLDRVAESSVYKVLAPAVLAVLLSIVGYQASRMNDRMDRVEALLIASDKAGATMELRVQRLEALVPERAAAIKQLQDKSLLLEFRVQDIEGREARTGRKMP